MRFHQLIIFLLTLNIAGLQCFAKTEQFKLSPLCNNDEIVCPEGFEAACADEMPGDTTPKCLFLTDKYVPGCWKFIGMRNLDLSLLRNSLPPSAMVTITSGGQTYTLNRDIIGCRKL